MTPWTEAAAKMWEDFSRRTRENLRDSGADADEVIDDLRRHIEEEIRTAKLSVVTEADMQRLLGRIAQPAVADTALPPEKKSILRRLLLGAALFFGVILPAGTLLFEIFTGASAALLFDPVPTWFQILAVAMVPLVNLWLWFAVAFDKVGSARWLGWLSGAAAGVALFYSVLYLPFAPLSAIAIVYFGIGLIPLAPYFSLLITLLLRVKARRSLGTDRFGRFWPAFGLGFFALALAQLPTFLTYHGLTLAAADDTATRRSGVNILRRFGDEQLILRACYGMNGRDATFDLIRGLGSGAANISPDKAREIYFRVTGRPFNSVAPPSYYTRAGRWGALDDDFDFTWDDALGGEAVAGRVKGLSLQSSRLDAVAEPAAAVAYCEWTMEFKNVSRQQREARAQISLPPGGVVSRVTLWIDGEEREAAFGGRSQTRKAYQKVAVQQRRDPVLVTTCGPDRVLMQCFPVPPNGGTLKVRLGITAPLALESPGRGTFQWPQFLERNFKIPPDFRHAAWIESPLKLSAVHSALAAAEDAQKCALHGALQEGLLGGVLVDRPADLQTVWTPALAEGQIIRQHLEPFTRTPVSRMVLVIDGSAGMKAWADSLADAVAKIPPESEIAIIMADDIPSAAPLP
ncbi:MAG TPA: VIT domain-containing protein, partial [Verrucomicrobiae bacterium]